MTLKSRSDSTFQSTLSVRRATLASCSRTPTTRYISIHALRKESDYVTRVLTDIDQISIHALRKESDLVILSPLPHMPNFNPRSP